MSFNVIIILKRFPQSDKHVHFDSFGRMRERICAPLAVGPPVLRFRIYIYTFYYFMNWEQEESMLAFRSNIFDRSDVYILLL